MSPDSRVRPPRQYHYTILMQTIAYNQTSTIPCYRRTVPQDYITILWYTAYTPTPYTVPYRTVPYHTVLTIPTPDHVLYISSLFHSYRTTRYLYYCNAVSCHTVADHTILYHNGKKYHTILCHTIPILPSMP